MEQNKKDKILNDIAKTALVVGGTFLLYKTVQHGIKYLQQVDSPLVGAQRASILEFNRLDSRFQGQQKLKAIDEFLQKGDSLSNEIALLLISSTFERFISDLHKCSCNTKLDRKKGMMPIVKDLRSNEIIDRDTYDRIKLFVSDIRNPTVHGDFDSINMGVVLKHYNWIKSFMLEYSQKYNRKLRIT